jgi:hypothetical protein
MHKYGTASIAMLALLIVIPVTVQAQSIADLPDPARVLDDMKGSDIGETSGRQNAALTQLSRVIDELKAGATLPPDQQKVKDAYDAALSAFRPPGGEAYKKFHDTYYRYEKDDAFRNELLGRYVSADWQKRYHERHNAPNNPAPAAQPDAWKPFLDKFDFSKSFQFYSLVMFAAFLSLAILCALFGHRLRRQLRRYEFEHMSDGGVVGFEKFEDSERHGKRWKRVHARDRAVGVFLWMAGCTALLYFLRR